MLFRCRIHFILLFYQIFSFAEYKVIDWAMSDSVKFCLLSPLFSFFIWPSVNKRLKAFSRLTFAKLNFWIRHDKFFIMTSHWLFAIFSVQFSLRSASLKTIQINICLMLKNVHTFFFKISRPWSIFRDQFFFKTIRNIILLFSFT